MRKPTRPQGPDGSTCSARTTAPTLYRGNHRVTESWRLASGGLLQFFILLRLVLFLRFGENLFFLVDVLGRAVVVATGLVHRRGCLLRQSAV